MFDGASAFAAGQQRSLLPPIGKSEDDLRAPGQAEPRSAEASAAADDGFGPSVLLPDAVKAIEKSSDLRSSTEGQGKPPPPSGDGGGASPTQAEGAESDAGAQEASSDEDADSPYELTEEEEEVVEELQERDAEVRAHENAHASAGGQYAGAPTYSYTTGPDGKQYATGGAVSIDTSTVSGDPQATVTKMATVIRAALAPAEPSAQDRNVAQDAQRKMAAAQVDLAKQNSQPVSDEAENGDKDDGNADTASSVGSSGGSASFVSNAANNSIQQAVTAYQLGGLLGS